MGGGNREKSQKGRSNLQRKKWDVTGEKTPRTARKNAGTGSQKRNTLKKRRAESATRSQRHSERKKGGEKFQPHN